MKQPLNIRILTATVILLACLSADTPAVAVTRKYSYKVAEVLPHNITSYTQGFFFHNGYFYESTGQYGRSLLAKVDPATGRINKSHSLDKRYFGEGACLLNGCIYQLTWEENTCFIYDPETFQVLGTRSYRREGWGLTTNGSELIMSDGSAKLYFMDPNTLTDIRSITVRMDGKEVNYLNELEYIEGEIWANIYTSDLIVRIDPANGNVTGVINLKGILPGSLRIPSTDVLNGIAYDPITKRIWVTGKYWPKIYRIEIKN